MIIEHKFDNASLRDIVRARRLPSAAKLGVLPRPVMNSLINYWNRNKGRNDLPITIKNRKQKKLPLRNEMYLRSRYTQIYLRICADHSSYKHTKYSPRQEQDLTEILVALEDILGPLSRPRVSALKLGARLPRHIDDPNQIRVLALLKGAHRFNLYRDGQPVSVCMRPGDLWYINTAWPHEVVNRSSYERLALLLDLKEMPCLLQEVNS